MKTRSIIIGAFMAISLASQGHWEVQNPLPTYKNLTDVRQVTPLTSFAVGDEGTIIKTIDGGSHWEMLNSNVQANLFALSFADTLTGFVIGDNGTLIKTTDGGSHWTTFCVEHDMQVRDILMTSALEGWATGMMNDGSSGKIYHTTNGGMTWETLLNQPSSSIDKICFTDGMHGWAITSFAVLFITLNGGITWEPGFDFSSTVPYIADITFSDPLNGWVIGCNNDWSRFYISRTTDGGLTWDTIGSPGNNFFSSLLAKDSLHAWVAGPGIACTEDGGVTWEWQLNGNNIVLSAMHSCDYLHMFAVGGSGRIYCSSDAGVGWNSFSPTYQDLNSTCFQGFSNGWSVGSEGTIIHTADKGHTWVKQNSPTTHNLFCASFSDTLHGWIAGDSGTILHTPDGGISWTPQPSGTVKNLHSIAFPDELNGWAVGDSGTILHTADGGTTWVALQSNATVSFNSLSFPDPVHGWVASAFDPFWAYNSKLIRTGDGGITWQELAIPGDYLEPGILNVCFLDSLKGWVSIAEFYWYYAGTPTTIYATSDGGNTWGYNLFIDGGPNTRIFFTDSLNGWMVGRIDVKWGPHYDYCIRTYNGGQSWEDLGEFGSGTARDVSSTDPDNGWIVGPNGLVLHTDHARIFISKLEDKSVCMNDSIAFEGTVSGPPPFQFQWQKNRINIEGATGQVYPIPCAVSGDTGNYRYYVSNGYGTDTSNAARLTVYFSATDLGDKVVCEKDNVAFEGNACGPPPFQFQWQKDGVNIEGATGQVYPIPRVNREDSGQYRFIVSNAYATDTSNSARLNVHFVPPADIYGQTSVSPYQVETYSVIMEPDHSYSFSCAGGNMIDYTSNSITVHWGRGSPGFITLLETDELGCRGDTVVLEIQIQSLGWEDAVSSGSRILNWPNPFESSTTIFYFLDEPSEVVLQIFNSYGELVDEQFIMIRQIGEQRIEWNSGALPADIYCCRIKAGNKVLVGKMVKY